MKKRWIVAGISLGLLACSDGSGGASHVEISGKTPAEGATIAANAVCMHEARCGSLTIACTSGGAAGGAGSNTGAVATTCTGTIDTVDFGKCMSDGVTALTKLLSCPSITPDQVNQLETCFDMLDAQPCVTQAEADAEAKVAATGGQIGRPNLPAACDLLQHPPAGC
jgi:hypothetical protein